MFHIKLNAKLAAYLRVASVFAVIFLLTLQYFWIRNAYRTVEKNFITDCQKILKGAFEEELYKRNDKGNVLFSSESENYDDKSPSKTFNMSNSEELVYIIHDLFLMEDKKVNVVKIDSAFRKEITKLYTSTISYNIEVVKSPKISIEEIKKEKNKVISTSHEIIILSRIGTTESLKLVVDSPIYIILWQARTIFLISIILIALVCYVLILQFKNYNRQKHFSDMLVEYTRMLAHDLQSPISSIQMMLNQVRKGTELKKESQYVFQLGVDYSERMLHNISNLLYLSVGENKKLNVNKTMVDAELLLGQICERVKRLNQSQRTVHFSIHLTPSRFFIPMDLVLMENVFYNLVENAVKYADEVVHLTIVCTKIEKGYTISFQDDGLGMDKKSMKRIFELFNRGDRNDGMSLSGFGVGLNVVQKIIHAHQGRISVESELGIGSTFILFLPKE